MARQLSQLASNAIAKKDLKTKRTFKINDVDRTSFFKASTRSFDKAYGSASASFTLHNPNGVFSPNGIYEINVGDVVEFIYEYEGDTISYPCFYGVVNQRGITKNAQTNEITLNCLDYISMLQQWDIDLLIEGNKIQVENETLSANLLPAPNDMFAQVFNFANDSIATSPTPTLQIRDRNHELNDPQYDGYECFSKDTEVLTEKGWMYLKDIVEKKLKIKVATLNHDTNKVEYHFPEKYISYNYSGKMLLQEGKRINFQVTPNHQIWRRAQNKNDYSFIKAENLERYIHYRKDFPYEGEEKKYFILPEYKSVKYTKGYTDILGRKCPSYESIKIFKERKILMDDWLAFFGIWLSEGWLARAKKNKKYCFVLLCQNEGKKLKEIKKIVSKISNTFDVQGVKNKTIRFSDVQLAQYLNQFGKCYDKFIPREFLNLSKRQLKIMFDAMMLGDGSTSKATNLLYNTSSKKLADNVQELILKLGKASNLSIYNHHYTKRENTKYVVSVNDRLETGPNYQVDKRAFVDYNDYVYCLTVPNHLLYIRRKGKGCWSGNCYYSSGQVKFGFPLNVADNYDVIAKSYSYYTSGVFVEDAIEQILTQPNGYGGYMFGETSAKDVIDNHLTETFYNASGLTLDTLTPNFTPTVTILTGQLTEDYIGAKNPIIHYKLNDATNNDNVTDTSDNYHGSFREGTEYAQTIIATEISGKIDRAFNFDQTDWNINCGDVTELNDCRRATFTFWLASDDFGEGSGGTLSEQIYFIKTNGATTNPSYFKLYTTVSDELIFETAQQGVVFKATLENYSSYITRTEYSHYRLVLDFTEAFQADKAKLFIDDVEMTLVITGANNPPRLPNTLGFDFLIGNTTNSIAGYLDDFRFYDFIVPNSYSSAIYNSGNGTEDTISVTYLVLDSTQGFLEPESGETEEGEINGDIFTYTSLDATHLYGIPLTGENSLSEHKSGSIAKASITKDTGKIWYLKYSNVITDLTTEDFNLPSGVTVEKFDKRYGRIYLSEPVSVSSVITTDTNYSFKTLQASGVEINRIRFTQRETENRFEAINKLRDYVAPNYIIRTQGDRKIWSSFLSQRTVEDFNLSLISNLNYLEDTDLYTRVVLFGMNNNPTNLMFGDSVEFVTTGEEYKGYASLSELTLIGGSGTPIIPDGADETYRNWINERVSAEAQSPYYLYSTGIPNAGYITVESVVPTVWIDNVAVDNKKHQQIMQPVRWEKTTTTETTTTTKDGFFGTGGGTKTETKTYYHYKIIFAHHSIEPTEDIVLYDAFGVEVIRITAGSNMGYEAGVYTVPGSSANSTVESIATATYWVFYSTSNLVIDYENAIFKIHKSLIPFPSETLVRATFEYIHTMTPIQGIAKVIDGRWDTQVQTTFFAEPPTGYNYGIIDLGQESNIQAIDIVAGFFKPDEVLKFDIDMTFTIHYSLDNVNYYLISDKTANLHLTGGASLKLEEDDLGLDFRARYLKVIMEQVKKVEYKKGVWPVAFTEFSAYGNITLKAEAKLIPTTILVNGTLGQSGSQDIEVVSTAGFTEPESGETATAFIGDDEFTYSSLDSTHFYDCVGLTEPHSRADYVIQYEETDTDVYDPDFLLPKLGDRLYKNLNIKEGFLYSQDEIDRISKAYLREFYKNHSKAQVEVMFSPYLLIGDTVRLVDTVNGTNDLYFIESISENNGVSASLTIARYPN